ncbi:MAG TPA: 2'-5' RNA ligase family protein [Candidatus Saccharimonadales bacterium]|nr:2'-5' RNA ligase family protein [Candidatus Saccharimonadales bacterium]
MSEKNNSDNGERYFYVFLTENREVGEVSKHTPQHITLIPPFAAGRSDVVNVASETASEFSPFRIETGEKETFGPKRDISVILIKPSEILTAIHVSLLKKLNDRDIVINLDEFIGENYTPHIAIKPSQPDLEGAQPILFDHIAVIQKNKNIKTVIAKNALRGVQ